jgi:ABC-2 type transport system ATP-binding protein
MIEVDRVSKWYGGGAGGGGFRAVQDVSMTIREGQCVGLLGPNGAGKTTTIRMITGYLPPSAGSIRVNGRDTIHDSVAARRLIGYLPESTPLYPEMRVRDYLEFRARLFGAGRSERKAAVGKAMDRCWLSDVQRRRIGQLSKGFKQRVGLAGALVHNPPVLILDEPTSGLDPSQIRETRSLIKGLAQDRTVLVSSHILPEVEQTCDRVIIIARGRVRADGSPSELVARVRTGREHRCEVRVGAEGAERVRALLAGVSGVASVRVEGEAVGWTAYGVTPAPGVEDVREGMARALAGAGVVCRELSRARGTLEQVFLGVVEAEDDGGMAAAGGAA